MRNGPGVPQTPGTPPSAVDAAVYTDPARWERERERIFRRSWLIVGREADLPAAGDHLVWEGHGETVVIVRRPDGSLGGFHNVCQHRGMRLVPTGGHGARRFTCGWHGWVYDLDGRVVGVPDREDFAPWQVDGCAAPPVAVSTWGGWIWAWLDPHEGMPSLAEWLGPDIADDLGRYRMETMTVLDRKVYDLPVNWKVVVDGFNEAYHIAAAHHVPAEDVKAARESSFFTFGRNSMMVVPLSRTLPKLRESGDHQSTAICHYVVFPNSVFNNNPEHIQLFQPVPLAVDRTRFECWELVYADGDEAYRAWVAKAWSRLQVIVEQDVHVFAEVAATRASLGYRRNLFSERECKLTAFHAHVEELIS